MDWLELYGPQSGFLRDTDLPGYDPRTDFTKFLFEKTKEFEAAVSEYLKTITTVVTIATNPGDARRLEKAEETFAAMEHGAPVIYQGVLWDAENRTYGVPDFLIRSDELLRLFPGSLTSPEATQSANDLSGASWHYRVVDLKFTTLDLLAGGQLGNSGSNPAYKGQLFVYNHALGRSRLLSASLLPYGSWLGANKAKRN